MMPENKILNETVALTEIKQYLDQKNLDIK